MKNSENKMTKAEEVKYLLENAIVPKGFESNTTGIIPLGKSVLLKRIKKGEEKLSSGLIIAATNSSADFVGRVVAVGPQVDNGLKIGLKVIYNELANMESYINGDTYIKVHQDSIYYVLLDEQVKVNVAPETPEQIRIKKKIKEQEATLKRVAKKQANDEDKYTETLKKGTKKSPKKRTSK